MVKSLANTVAKAESLISHCRARPSQMATQNFGSAFGLTGSDHVVPFDGPAAAGHALASGITGSLTKTNLVVAPLSCPISNRYLSPCVIMTPLSFHFFAAMSRHVVIGILFRSRRALPRACLRTPPTFGKTFLFLLL